jgi:LmbE family N-acetylglucosaminyl deacetylase
MVFSRLSHFLVVSAHPDDEVLGFGASAYVLTQRGHSVSSCIVVGDADARRQRPQDKDLRSDTVRAHQIVGMSAPSAGPFPNIRLNTVPHLDLVRFIENAMLATEPDVLITHHPSDVNDDHYQVSRATQAAARLAQRRPEVKPISSLLFMEVLSSTDWRVAGASLPFDPQVYIEIGEEALEAKLTALDAYRNVMRPYPHPRSTESVRALATLRGSDAGLNLAEAFQLGLWINRRPG